MPSALIPFCSYGSDMEAVGKDFGNFSFPICDSFKATLHQGRVCYKLHLDSQLKSKDGMDGGLMLLVDTNSERSVELPDVSRGPAATIRKQINFAKPVKEGSVEVYISTLAPLTFSQPGEYRLNSLKKMTGTESFTMLPHSVTKCYDGNFEACKNSRLLKASLKECGCVPWALKSFTQKVNFSILTQQQNTILQVNPFCNPSSNGCFLKQMSKDYKCLDACFGLYADVTYINSTEKIGIEGTKDFSDLGREYKNYKKKFLENINFDSTKVNYGKFIFQCNSLSSVSF